MNEELINTNNEGAMTKLARWILSGNFTSSYIKYFFVALIIGVSITGILFGLIGPLMKTNTDFFNIVYFAGEPIIYIIYAIFLILFCRGFYVVKSDLSFKKRLIQSVIYTIPVFFIINITFTVIVQWS